MIEEASPAGRSPSRGTRLKHAAAASVVSRGIGVAGSLLLTPIIIHGVGAETFGVFATITSLAALSVVADLGFGAGLVAKLAHALGRDDLDEAQRLVSTAWGALTALGLLLAGLLSCAAWWLPLKHLLGADGYPASTLRWSVVVFAVALGLALPTGMGDRVMAATQRGAANAAWAVVSTAATMAAAVLTVQARNSLPAVVAAATLTPRAIGAIQTVFVFRNVVPDLRPRIDLFSRAALSELRDAGALFVVQGLAIAVAFESDVLVVSSQLGARAAATYTVNLRVIALAGSLAVIALGQLFPAFADALARGDLVWVRRTFRRLTLALGAYAVVLGLLLLAIEPFFVRRWAGAEFVPPPLLLGALVAWTVYTTVLIPANMLMNAALVVRAQVLVAVAMAVVNLPLSIALTRSIGIAGPAWGSVLAHTGVSLVPTVIIVRRLLRRGFVVARPT